MPGIVPLGLFFFVCLCFYPAGCGCLTQPCYDDALSSVLFARHIIGQSDDGVVTLPEVYIIRYLSRGSKKVLWSYLYPLGRHQQPRLSHHTILEPLSVVLLFLFTTRILLLILCQRCPPGPSTLWVQ